jgi:YegS/Rv2252/BmrU family lipid kinase
METVVIVNPASRSGATGRRLPELKRLLAAHLPDHGVYCTEGPRDAERLAREAAAVGVARVVVAGGDGTVCEAVTGLLHGSARSEVELGLLPLGSGSDFARTLGLGSDLEAAVRRLRTGRKVRVDAGRVTVRTPGGELETRCFLNEVSFGLSAEAVRFVDELARKGRRGRSSYLLAGLSALLGHAPSQVRVSVDGQPAHDGPLMLGAVANGRYFGAGMQVAPQADVSDARFDVVLVAGMSKLSALRCFPQLMRGRHASRPDVSTRRGVLVEATATQPVWVEVDGELLGQLPARIELMPLALTVCG